MLPEGTVPFGIIFGVGAGLMKRVQPFCLVSSVFVIHLRVRLIDVS